MTNGGANGEQNRPEVLDNISTTQMDELERHFAEGDRPAWSALGQSYGWSREQSDAVWAWFGQRPTEG